VTKQDLIGEENRRCFETWGLKRVRQMVAAGHYDAEQRQPMLIWLAEKDARLAKRKRVVLVVGVVLVFVGLFIALLAGVIA
jgi:hypothetical protein